MEPYVGIVIFELAKSNTSLEENNSFFREDFYIVYADSEEAAHKLVEKRAHEEETPKDAAQDSGPTVTLRHIIDVAPALYGYVDKDCDLYSRHFASLEDYARFEMMLGGKDPLSH
ncbi:hypothetical protein B1A54_03615 [Corynebacterium diphtheriae]|uniref:DUF4288 domain-containing protein n=1 Tax=Corynebacterium diphtheriae TaxID=1717 RepID=UPI000892EE37|nr:DUF4288 domain-containing protein [Corynebacterium diphtheriae]OFI63440.1 hypothetical protein BKD87_03195 [Corynebacterium diphtheriae]OSQ19115.1 hypothetical protein B1A54_03615 [Corynebacterium diphtheriae]